MFSVNTLNPIAKNGLQLLNSESYQLNQTEQPHALLLRSFSLHDYTLPDSVQIIARAGAGTNNIPIDTMTHRGIPVLNTPGANANAVKELVLTGLLLASRHVVNAWDFCRQLEGSEEQQHHAVEQQKKQFIGGELFGKTLAVIGLGAIGVKVANSARQLGMQVIGYDPAMSVQNAWQLRASVTQADSITEAVSEADFVTVHVPHVPATEDLINADIMASMPKGAVLLNFARSQIVSAMAVKQALEMAHLRYYVCDFPCPHLKHHSQVICLPHLGASTHEAQENCAVMAVEQIKAFLEHGHIINSVNFPAVKMRRQGVSRLAVVNRNVPNMVAQIAGVLSQAGLNIINMVNRSREQIAYTLLDLEQAPSDALMKQLKSLDGVVRVRLI